MAKSKLVGLLFEAWKDMDRALGGLAEADAVRGVDGGSSFAWTAAHVANQVDAWLNVRFQRCAPHPLIGQQRFRFGGTGVAGGWLQIQAGVREVRQAARAYLEPLGDGDLDVVIPYDGTFAHLRETGLPLRYALLRTCAHHFYHIGEIATKRSGLGQEAGDYPGLLEECLGSRF